MCVAGVKLLIISTHEIKYFWYVPEKVSFLFCPSGRTNGKQTASQIFFSCHFSLVLLSLARLECIILGANYIWCKHSLHIENGLECLFNEWI